MTERAYCRVYYSIIDDERFVGIYDDNNHLATWLRLLIAADAIWPASPGLPVSARKQSVAALVTAGLVDLLPSGRFRIHGLDTERGARRDNARSSVAHRTNNERTSNVERNLYSRSEPSRAETEPSQAEPIAREKTGYPEPHDEDDALDVYHRLTGYRPWGVWSGDTLRALIGEYGDTKVQAGLTAETTAGASRADLLKRTQARLAKEADREREAKPEPIRRRKKTPEDEAAAVAEQNRIYGEALAESERISRGAA